MGETLGESSLSPDFVVDNDLSPLIALTLRLFDYRAYTIAEVFGTHDLEDPDFIPRLAEMNAVWINMTVLPSGDIALS